jgi:hypothetical protein
MDKKRSQHFNFTFETLPILFHSQTKDFFHYLEEDGLKFLNFWWNHMGVRLGLEESEPFEGVNFDIKELPEKKSRLILLRLPEPKKMFECYLIGFLEQLKKRFPVRLPNTRVFVLERVPEKIEVRGTSFGEITRGARYIRIGPGTKADEKEFEDQIIQYCWKKSLRSRT